MLMTGCLPARMGITGVIGRAGSVRTKTFCRNDASGGLSLSWLKMAPGMIDHASLHKRGFDQFLLYGGGINTMADG